MNTDQEVLAQPEDLVDAATQYLLELKIVTEGCTDLIISIPTAGVVDGERQISLRKLMTAFASSQRSPKSFACGGMTTNAGKSNPLDPEEAVSDLELFAAFFRKTENPRGFLVAKSPYDLSYAQSLKRISEDALALMRTIESLDKVK